MGVLADLIALVNGNTEKTLDVLIQERATETNGKVDSLDTKVQTGNNLIGATNNTGGTASAGSIFAKLNKLLTDWTTARAGYLDTINSNVGTLINGRVVKSVQRGVYDAATAVQYTTIYHSYVDVNKSMIIINGGKAQSYDVTPYINNVSPTSFTIHAMNNQNLFVGCPISWQIIEFY